MRLYDIIQKAVGTNLDIAYQGLIGNFAKDLQKAQCFEMSAPVVTACATVAASKPSSIVAATPMLRLPYPSIWLEWYSDRGDYMRQNEKLTPERMGCLLVSDGEISNRGIAYWAWYHHEADLTIGPFGIAFDWDMSRPPVIAQLIERFNLPAYLLDTMSKRFGGALAAQAVLVNTEKWYKSADKDNSDKEKQAFISLEKRAAIVPNHHAMKFIKEYRLLDPKNPGMNQFIEDVCGELPFVEAFIIMLNSRHILERVQDDFTRLNKARDKQRKTLLREFTTTKLRLTRTSINRAKAAAGMDRNTARLHLVRGHFKIRSSGIYWWSSFARGNPTKPVQRTEYKAT